MFDEKLYEVGRVLVFECPSCNKQFRIRIPEPKDISEEEETSALAKLVVIENAFHFKQEIPLYDGENVVGR